MALLMRFSKRTLATDRIASAFLKVKNALNMRYEGNTPLCNI